MKGKRIPITGFMHHVDRSAVVSLDFKIVVTSEKTENDGKLFYLSKLPARGSTGIGLQDRAQNKNVEQNEAHHIHIPPDFSTGYSQN